MALTNQNINALGNIIDTSWGKSSTERSGSPQFSIKCKLLNDQRMMVEYCTIVNLFGAEEMHQRSKQLEDVGVNVIKKYLKQLKDDFHDSTGDSLKLDLVENWSSVEMISMSSYNPKRTAYFRVTALVDYNE